MQTILRMIHCCCHTFYSDNLYNYIILKHFHILISSSSPETTIDSNEHNLFTLSNVKQYTNTTGNLNNKAFEATLLFRTLELWMNLHLVRKRSCLGRVMCEGISNIVNEGHVNDVVVDAKSVAMMYAEISGHV